MQAQDRSVSRDTSYPSAVMPGNSQAAMGQSVLDAAQVTTAAHLKMESWHVLRVSGHSAEQQNVMTVQKAALVQIVDRYLRFVNWDSTRTSRTLLAVINASLGLNVRQLLVLLWIARQVWILSHLLLQSVIFFPC